jgi:hypothetical protein
VSRVDERAKVGGAAMGQAGAGAKATLSDEIIDKDAEQGAWGATGALTRRSPDVAENGRGCRDEDADAVTVRFSGVLAMYRDSGVG